MNFLYYESKSRKKILGVGGKGGEGGGGCGVSE